MIDSTSTQIIVDSLKSTKSASSSDWILHHVMDGDYLDFSPFFKIYLPHFELFGIDLSITRHVLFMWLGALLLFIVMTRVAKAYKSSMVPKGFTNFWELFIVFVRDEIVKPTIGKGFEKFLPYLLTAVFLLPIMIVVELLGLLAKPFALAIRLFANMTAGHIVIYALISLIFVMQSVGWAGLAIPMALFIYGLEVLVALLQAYIFTMLS